MCQHGCVLYGCVELSVNMGVFYVYGCVGLGVNMGVFYILGCVTRDV